VRALYLPFLIVVALGACHRKPAAVKPAAPPPVVSEPAPPLDPNAAENAAILQKVAAVFACFEKRMKADVEKPGLELYARTSYTDMFLFDRIVGDRQGFERSPEAICQSVVTDYQALYRATVKTARAPRAGGPKPPPIDGRPEFIRAARGRTTLHALKHAELTRAALTEVLGRTRPVVDVVGFGAEQTDIFAWSDGRYLAQTNPFEPTQREGEIQSSQVAFVGGMAALLDRFREDISDGNFDHAAIVLGVLCHAAQDLVFHHGMSRRQLAGVRFLGTDPYGAESAAEQAEAKRWSKEMIGFAQRALRDRKLWERFLAWVPPAGFNLDTAAVAVFREDQAEDRLNLVALTRYWISHLVYRRSPELQAELTTNMIRWDIPPIFDQLRRAVGNGQVAVRGAR
jgi:hypothetical protein